MSASAAFYQILFEHETLFRSENKPSTLPDVSQSSNLQTPVAEKAVQPIEVQPAVSAMLPHPPASQPTFPALEHHILILTNNPKNEKLSEAEKLLLANILKAVGHAPDKTDILNFSFLPSADARKVLSEKRTHFFITFGVPLVRLHLDLLLVPYTPKHEEGIWFLLADPLSAIDTDKILKKKLWQALQKMFERP
jgi:hypothetical protein